MPYYAVRDGRNPGVYTSWGQCENEVKHYSGASFKKFDSPAAAEAFASGGGSSYSSSSYGGGYGGGGRSSRYDSGSSADVYTDGACPNNGRGGNRSGIGVYWGNNDSRNVSEPHYGRQTNNSAEIGAATRAVRQAGESGVRNLTVHTDSDFMVKGATQWMHNWKSNGWKTSTGGDVKNKDDFQSLDRAMRDNNVNVNFKHVKGHSGNYGNEQADRLATRGARYN